LLYLLLSVGVFLILCGGYLILREKRARGRIFREVVKSQSQENGDWIRLLAASQELKVQMETVEKKLDGISVRLGQTGQQVKSQAEVPSRSQTEVPSKPQTGNRSRSQERFPEKPSGKGLSVHRDYREAACRVADMRKQNKSVEDMASSLHMEKGEILFIQGLLEQKRKDS